MANDDMSVPAIVNALTIDVEDYFQVSAMAGHIDRANWDSIPCRVERNVERLLHLFEKDGVYGTFFILGWLAERYPGLVRSIVAAGHELASHGYAHLRATEQSREEFFQDISRAKRLLEDTSGVEVIGYRAPSFSIGVENPWAFDVLHAAGYRYSSSIYPVRHDHYGVPDAPRFPYCSREGLLEIPITTVSRFGRNLPAGGGGYFRFLPYSISRLLIRLVNENDRRPAIFYLHPWEIDPEQPRILGIGLKTRFRHYVNLSRTESRLACLIKDFQWNRIDRVFRAELDLVLPKDIC